MILDVIAFTSFKLIKFRILNGWHAECHANFMPSFLARVLLSLHDSIIMTTFVCDVRGGCPCYALPAAACFANTPPWHFQASAVIAFWFVCYFQKFSTAICIQLVIKSCGWAHLPKYRISNSWLPDQYKCLIAGVAQVIDYRISQIAGIPD